MSGPCLLDRLDRIVADLAEEAAIDPLDQAQRGDLIEKVAAETGLDAAIVAEAVDRVLGAIRE
jgi:hypothetical protein